MTNKDMNRCLTSLVIGGIQTNTTMGYHNTPIRRLKLKTKIKRKIFKKVTMPSADKVAEQIKLCFSYKTKHMTQQIHS